MAAAVILRDPISAENSEAQCFTIADPSELQSTRNPDIKNACRPNQ
jgi:hypothetical protein